MSYPNYYFKKFFLECRTGLDRCFGNGLFRYLSIENSRSQERFQEDAWMLLRTTVVGSAMDRQLLYFWTLGDKR